MTNQVQLQNLRNFTVQIRHEATGVIVGTGIVVSNDGKVLTCAHVVRSSGVEPRQVSSGRVNVYFPQDRKTRRARIDAFLASHEDDIVMLQIEDEPVPFGTEQVASLGTASGSEGNVFRSYGYAPLANIISRYVYGTIMGPVEGNAELNTKLRADLVQLNTRDIRPGISGSAVLDEKRNLVIGLITERWNPGGASEDDNLGWATDAKVLTFNPFNFSIHNKDLPLREVPRVELQLDEGLKRSAAKAGRASGRDRAFSSPSDYFINRRELLTAITEDWIDPKRRVTGLIGPAGLGKTTVARLWLDRLVSDVSLPQPDRVFWWSFTNPGDVDLFFESAVSSLLSQGIENSQYQSVASRAQLLAALLGEERLLLVLDGLDTLQHQGEDQFGLLENNDLRDFVKYLGSTAHGSHCLITSRMPILDLIGLTTYNQHQVGALDASESVELLHRLGLKVPEEDLAEIVRAFQGNPSALKLAASTLVSGSSADLAQLGEVFFRYASRLPAQVIDKAFVDFQARLSRREVMLLTILSALRAAATKSALEVIVRTNSDQRSPDHSFANISSVEIDAAIQHFLADSWLKYEDESQSYSLHPLIREQFLARQAADNPKGLQAIHERIEHYYLSASKELPFRPSVEDFKPLAEALYHACCAGRYDDAYKIFIERVYQGKRRLLVNELGAWEFALAMLSDFFLSGDTSQEPQLTDRQARVWVLNETGLTLSILGRLSASAASYVRSLSIAMESENWRGASIASYNLAQIYALGGYLSRGLDAANRAVEFATRSGNEKPLWVSLACQAWIYGLIGRAEQAGAIFEKAQEVRWTLLPSRQYLTGLAGIWYGDYLRRQGNISDAYAVTRANRNLSKRYRWSNQLSQCHRVLGDLRAAAKISEAAHGHYDKAIEIARTTSNRTVLIEALLARGRWAAKSEKDIHLAMNDLLEALEQAVAGGFRVYEADIRIALAWAHFESNDLAGGLAEGQRAQVMSKEMGYHWGEVDATEVISRLK